jgi:hypothetical protein
MASTLQEVEACCALLQVTPRYGLGEATRLHIVTRHTSHVTCHTSHVAGHCPAYRGFYSPDCRHLSTPFPSLYPPSLFIILFQLIPPPPPTYHPHHPLYPPNPLSVQGCRMFQGVPEAGQGRRSQHAFASHSAWTIRRCPTGSCLTSLKRRCK